MAFSAKGMRREVSPEKHDSRNASPYSVKRDAFVRPAHCITLYIIEKTTVEGGTHVGVTLVHFLFSTIPDSWGQPVENRVLIIAPYGRDSSTRMEDKVGMYQVQSLKL